MNTNKLSPEEAASLLNDLAKAGPNGFRVEGAGDRVMTIEYIALEIIQAQKQKAREEVINEILESVRYMEPNPILIEEIEALLAPKPNIQTKSADN